MTLASYLTTFAALSALANAQAGPNTLAQYNPSVRTQSINSTWCILPISKADAETISGHATLDVPKSVLPSFPEGMHPLIVQAGISNDIRMTALNVAPLQIPALMQASIIVPYSDVIKDGKTPINVPINTYIGGTDGNSLQALVPSIAATISPFEGTTTFPTTFVPDTDAAQTLPGGIYSIEVKATLLDNMLSGPGIYAEAFDMLYTLIDEEDAQYTEHTFHDLLNHPQLLNNGNCQRNTYYFTETFADPKMAVGNVTLYHKILATPSEAIEGHYTDVYCYQANSEQVTGTAFAESCADAAANVDPVALQ